MHNLSQKIKVGVSRLRTMPFFAFEVLEECFHSRHRENILYILKFLFMLVLQQKCLDFTKVTTLTHLFFSFMIYMIEYIEIVRLFINHIYKNVRNISFTH